MIALFVFFFFNDTATTEIYTLSLHDALPISVADSHAACPALTYQARFRGRVREGPVTVVLVKPIARSLDRKSTRLNSSHSQISYAVFCLKKKTLTTFVFLRDPFTQAAHLLFT